MATPLLDMTPDGRFRDVKRGPSLSMRIMLGATVLAVLAGLLALAALAFWLAITLIPVMLVAAVVAWTTLRYRVWRSGRQHAAGQFMSPGRREKL